MREHGRAGTMGTIQGHCDPRSQQVAVVGNSTRPVATHAGLSAQCTREDEGDAVGEVISFGG